jgi:hypothetical protein
VFATVTGTVNEYKKGTTADLTDGQKVIIVNTASNYALSGANFASPASVSPSSDKFSTTNSNIIWTVKKSNSSYAFKYGDNYLTLLTASPWINLINTPDYFTTSGSGPYVLTSGVNTAKSLEYFKGKFTGYNTDSGDAFNMDFYVPNWSYSAYSTSCAAPSCENPTIAFAEVGPINKLTTAAAFTNAATATLNDNPTGQTITYSGDNDAVAEVNSTTGEVTINGVGTVHITATAAEVANTYCEASESYTLVVSEPTHEYQYTHDFTALDISGWGNSYDERDAIAYNIYDGYDGNDDQVKFMGASSQSTIDNMPVIKGAAVNLVMLDNMKYISAVKFVCQQWTNKAQTKEIKYSTNGGTTWSSLDPVVSNSFTSSTTGATMKVECLTLPANVNAIQLYGTGTNQIGIASVSFDLVDKIIVKKTVTITAPAAAEGTLVVKNAGVAITSGDEIEVGTSLTIEAEANDGYSLSAISVKDESNADVEVTSNTFVVPSKNVTVSATFVVDARPQPVITIDNMALTFGAVATITPTVTVAASASDVTYEIKEGSDDCITLAVDQITAKSVEGTATIVASIAGTTDYKPATREFTVTVSDPRYKAERTAFTALEGKVATVSAGTHKDKEYISYATFKGTGTTDPKAENNILTFYKPASGKSTGGYIMISAVKGCTIDEVQVTNAGSKSTTIGCSTTSTLATSGTAYGLNATVSFTILNNSSVVYIDDIGGERVDITKLVVYYTGEPATIHHYTLDGTYTTVFDQNTAFSHEGLIVYACYDALETDKVDITSECTFSDPDMNTVGEQTIEITYNSAVVTSYTITVNAGKALPNLVYTPANQTITEGDVWTAPELTYTSGVTGITYESSKPAVATVDENGVIALAGGYGTAIITASLEENGDFIAGSAMYTITVNEKQDDVTGTWNLVKDAADLMPGMQVIVAQYVAESGSLYTLGGPNGTNANNRLAVSGGSVAISETTNVLTPAAGTKVLTLVDAGEGKFALQLTNGNYLYAAGGTSNNHLKEQSNIDNKAQWSIEIEGGVATIKANITGSNKRDWMRYNATNNPKIFSCYGSGQSDIALYVKAFDVTRAVDGQLGTICLANGGKMVGAAPFEIAYMDYDADNNPYKIYLDEVETMVPGVPYIFLPNEGATKLGVYYNNETAATQAGNYHGLYGTFSQIDQLEQGYYIIYNNMYYHVNSDNVKILANRAYIKLSEVPDYDSSENNPDPTKVRRRISMGAYGTQTATGLDELNASEAPVKVMIDGNLYILRGEKMYDATGRLVK